MRQVSAGWADGIASPHDLAVDVFPLRDGVVGAPLPITGGTVTLDLTAANRGRCDVEFGDPDLIPTTDTDPLAPYANKLVIRRGLVYPDGTREVVRLGTYLIEETTIGDDGKIQVAGTDLSTLIAGATFEGAYTLAGGTNFVTAVLNTAQAGFPGFLPRNMPTLGATTPTLKAEDGDDRWDFCQSMATAIGRDLYFDNEGFLVMPPIPEARGTYAVAHIVEGSAGVTVKPTLLSAAKKWSRLDAHNKWVATGDNPTVSGPQPRGEVIDDDPESPTYYHGLFGHRPAPTFSSSFIKDDAQALVAAKGRKAKEQGTTQSVDFGSVVNPALEPGDVVRITRTLPSSSNPENRIAVVDERHIIDSVTIPLERDGQMTGVTRSTRVF